MNEKLLKVWDWAVKSSADPTKLSLTLKGGLPLIVTVLALLRVDAVKESDLLTAIDAGVAVLAGLTTLIGLGRKIKNSLKA